MDTSIELSQNLCFFFSRSGLLVFYFVSLLLFVWCFVLIERFSMFLPNLQILLHIFHVKRHSISHRFKASNISSNYVYSIIIKLMLVYCIQSCKTEKNTYINCPEKILNLTSSTYILRYYTSVHTYSGLRSINDCMDKKTFLYRLHQ